MMAAAAVAAERGGGTGGTGAPGGPSPAGASARAEGSSPRPGSAGFSVLVVVGSLRANGLLERLLKQIETGEDQTPFQNRSPPVYCTKVVFLLLVIIMINI